MAARGIRQLFGQAWQTAFGYSVGGAASSAIDPIIEPFAQAAWEAAVAAGVSRALSPVELSQMVVQGILEEAAAAGEASKTGIGGTAFERLVRLAGEPPGPEQMFDLWDRGVVDEADVDRALLQSRLKPEWVKAIKALASQLLQVDALAEMVVQGVLDAAEARRRAGLLGYNGDDFDRLVRLAGNPPGPESMLEAWNRGLVDEAGVDRALVQSRLKPEWVDTFKKLRIRPASVAAAVSATIKERIPESRGIAIAAENGIDAETFRMLVDEGGRPISITEGLQLLRRRKITRERFREVVARSDVKSEFTDDLLGLQEVLPSLAQMRAIITTGAISDDVARDILQRLGLSDDVVAGVIAAGHGQKLEGVKQLTQSAVLNAYQVGQMSRADAERDLAGLGYDTNDAGVLLDYVDFQRAHSYRTAVIGVVKARFLQRDIDTATASGQLDKIGMPVDERDQYLDLWTFDRDANPHLLTLGQLNSALGANIITVAEYRDYLPRLGYVEPELGWLVQLNAPS